MYKGYLPYVEQTKRIAIISDWVSYLKSRLASVGLFFLNDYCTNRAKQSFA